MSKRKTSSSKKTSSLSDWWGDFWGDLSKPGSSKKRSLGEHMMKSHNEIVIGILTFCLAIFFMTTPSGTTDGKRPFWPVENPGENRKLWTSERDGPLTSQVPIDMFTSSHFVKGIWFYLALTNIFKLDYDKALAITFWVEVFWEILESTPLIINKYRQNEDYRAYSGDSIINSAVDIMVCVMGFHLAYKSPNMMFVVAIAIEVVGLYYHTGTYHNLLALINRVKDDDDDDDDTPETGVTLPLEPGVIITLPHRPIVANPINSVPSSVPTTKPTFGSVAVDSRPVQLLSTKP